MTFGQIAAAVYRVCGYLAPVQPIVVERVKTWINEAHRHCLRVPGLVELRQRSAIPFTSVTNQSIYALPLAFERIDAIVEDTSHRRLVYMSRDVFRSIDPAETSLGTPTHYVPEGWQPRFAVPHSSGIWAGSTAAPEIPPSVAPFIRLTGIRANGDPQSVTVGRITDATRGQVGPFTDYIEIVSWDLAATWPGDVSLYDDPVAGRELARIPAGRTSALYWCVRLWPTPSGPITYHVDGQIEIPDMLYDTDVPLLPVSFHDLLAAFARAREYERTGDSRFAVAQQEWERGLGQLRHSVNYPDDYKPVAGEYGSGALGHTNLPGMFPADWTWR